MTERTKKLAWAAVFVALATAISRVVGLAREVLTARYYGASGALSVFTSVSIVPNLISQLLADAAITAAFVPVFTELLLKGEQRRAWQLASRLLTFVLIVLGAIVVVVILFAPWIIHLVLHKQLQHDPSLYGTAITMTHILLPMVLVLSCAGLVTSILYSFERFTMPAIVSIVWNAIIIVFIVALAPALPAHQRIYALVLGSVTGTVAQLVLLVWATRGLGFRVRLSARFDDPLLRRVLLLMVPVTISIGILNFNALIDQAFAWLVSAAAPSQVYYTFRLYQLPQGIFAVTVAVVLFPSLARFAAQQDMTQFRVTLTMGVRQIFFVCLPFVAWFLVMPEAIVRLIYQHGHFTAASTHQVAGALAMSALGLAFASAAMMFTRGFQSLQRPWLPLYVGLANLALNAVLDLLLYKPLGVRGITLSTSIVSIWAFIAIVTLMRRQLGGLQLRSVIDGVARMTLCAALLAGVSYMLWRGLYGVADSGLGGLLAAVAVAFGGGGIVYLAAARLLRVEELAMVRRLLRRRGGGGGAGGAEGPGEEPLAPLPPDATPVGPTM